MPADPTPAAAVATVRETFVVPLPAGTCVAESVQVLAAGHPVNVIATAAGNVPAEGLTVMSYFAGEPAVITAGPELLIEKLNAPVCTVSERFTLALRDKPELPLTLMDE